MDLIDLHALVDTAHRVEEIVARWEANVGDAAFALDGAAGVDGPPSEGFFARTRAAPPRESVPLAVRKIGAAEVLDRRYGLRLNVRERAEPMYVDEFLTAQWPWEAQAGERSAALAWIAAPPLALNCTRNAAHATPYCSIRVVAHAGAFGRRLRALEAAIETLQDDLSALGPSAALERTLEAARAAAEKLRPWERERVDFALVRTRLRTAALKTITELGPGGKAAVLAPTRRRSPTVEAWVGRFTCGFEQNRAIAYFAARRDTALWPHVYAAALKAGKSAWPALVEILSRAPVSETDLERLLGFVADLNWPGAAESWDFLLTRGVRALPAVDAAIVRAAAAKDDGWEENLRDLRARIKARV
jgi:hypothetical protein